MGPTPSGFYQLINDNPIRQFLLCPRNYKGGPPSHVCWFAHPINWFDISWYIYHKPKWIWSSKPTNLAIVNGGPTLVWFTRDPCDRHVTFTESNSTSAVLTLEWFWDVPRSNCCCDKVMRPVGRKASESSKFHGISWMIWNLAGHLELPNLKLSLFPRRVFRVAGVRRGSRCAAASFRRASYRGNVVDVARG